MPPITRPLVVHVLLPIGVLMALACTATPATPAPTPLPTPDVPLFDETDVKLIALTHVLSVDANSQGSFTCALDVLLTNYLDREAVLEVLYAEYIGNDIWLVKVGFCTFTFHDKEARLILPQ